MKKQTKAERIIADKRVKHFLANGHLNEAQREVLDAIFVRGEAPKQERDEC